MDITLRIKYLALVSVLMLIMCARMGTGSDIGEYGDFPDVKPKPVPPRQGRRTGEPNGAPCSHHYVNYGLLWLPALVTYGLYELTEEMCIYFCELPLKDMDFKMSGQLSVAILLVLLLWLTVSTCMASEMGELGSF
ncbi:unnamed protein product [Oppiella nova]|uniref:Uncharacterized protein n=1 Tax=Oppiella nova TaxID=334625 RepID=A0A7R9LZU2_9ACAR|nr:unnamed protein product [Oppiella nova]CAG2168476.1 unnamed protein product [Oppiella nova]